ncbi:hypothetical protein MTO96_011109 [Rhipicephalus appendiculatus]
MCKDLFRTTRAVADRIARYGYLRVAHWTAWHALFVCSAYNVVQKKAEIISALSKEAKGFCKAYDCKKRDYGDFEWDAIVALFWSMRYWMLAHLVIGQLVAVFAQRFLQPFYVAYSLVFMVLCFPKDVWFRAVTMATASCIAVLLRRRSVAYVTGSAMVAITTLPVPFIPQFEFSPCVIGGHRSFEGSIFFTGWNVLRLVSVAVDLIDKPASARKDARKTVLHALAYLLYFPGLIAGPMTNYDDFMTESYRPPTWNRRHLLEFLARSARVVVGYCTMEVFLRLAYVRSAALTSRWFFAQSGWTLGGIVYFSSLQFYLKYNFAYGIPSLFFWLDNVYERHDLRPRCTTRIHTAANLWRYFDIGLYRWIVKYLYKAVIGDRWTVWRRFLGNHCQLYALQRGSRAETVLKGVLSAINLVATYGSCFFFLSNYDVASGVIGKLLVFPFPLLPVVFGLYCNAQVAMDIFEWERSRRPKKGGSM